MMFVKGFAGRCRTAQLGPDLAANTLRTRIAAHPRVLATDSFFGTPVQVVLLAILLCYNRDSMFL